MKRTYRVVVVDDSALMRQTVSDSLNSLRDVEVVATAASGPEAIAVIAEQKPDIVSLDIELPGMSGLEVLKHVMDHNPTGVVLVSAYTTAGAETTIEGLTLGALDFVPKPSIDEGLDVFRVRLRRTFRAALSAKLLPQTPPEAASQEPTTTSLRPTDLAIIASSTGGPGALQRLLSAFETPPAFPIVIVQHMPKTFTGKMAQRLNGVGPASVSEAGDGDELRAGHILVAPGANHIEIDKGVVRLTNDAPIGGLRPRADITLSSAAQSYGSGVTGIVLTGMGTDGLVGCRRIKRSGGQVIAQDQQSSTVDGMPRAVRDAGLADAVGDPAKIARALASISIHRTAVGRA